MKNRMLDGKCKLHATNAIPPPDPPVLLKKTGGFQSERQTR